MKTRYFLVGSILMIVLAGLAINFSAHEARNGVATPAHVQIAEGTETHGLQSGQG